METTFATSRGQGEVNEDAVVTGDGFAVVLDGATAEPDTDTGCRHGVRWFTRGLAAALARRLTPEPSADRTLSDLLHDAIDEVGRAHAGTCDLRNPCSPSATVAVLRHHDRHADYLVLGDSPILLEDAGGVRTVTDDRLARYTGPWEGLRHVRNAPGGFWVAGNAPEAAGHAVVGTAPVPRRAALLTDGVTRLVERYGWTWPELIAELGARGPAHVISRVREAERDTPDGKFAGKRNDDATAVLCRFSVHSGSRIDRH